MKPHVVLADDHAIFTEGLKALLSSEYEIVATVNNGRAAIQAVQNSTPAVVILDISMPLLNGFDAAREILKVDRKIKIVVLSMHNELEYVQEAFAAGASAYVIKHSASLDLLTAIRQAISGRAYITPGIPGVDEDQIQPFFRNSSHAAPHSEPLTMRQREVLQLLAEGRSAKEAAHLLNISARTVEFHKYRIMRLLGLRTSADITQYAIKNRIIAVH